MSASPPTLAPRRLSQLLAGIVEVPQELDRDIAGLSLDSRCARAGDLFFACAGQRCHGTAYLGDALGADVAAVAWEPSPDLAELPPPLGEGDIRIPAFAVQGLGDQIGVIADRFYGHPSRDLQVVGITGTDGKTSCAQFLAQALDREDEPCGVIGTLGYGLYGQQQPATHTTPDAIRLHGLLAGMRRHGARWAVMEVSSHALAQGRTVGVAFDAAVLTNLTRDHLDYHGDEQAYAGAKRRLFEAPGLRTAVLNLNDGFGCALLSELPLQTVGYGLGPLPVPLPPRYVAGRGLLACRDGLSMDIDSSWGEAHLQTRLLGAFNARNVLAVLAVLVSSGMTLERACDRLSRLSPVPGRMERFGGGRHTTVVVDYAHTPEALRHALEALRAHCDGTLWAVFGCGGDRDPGKRPLMGAVAERLADRVILTDDNPRGEDGQRIIDDIRGGMHAPEKARVERDRAAAIAAAVTGADPADLVLVAGKGHEDYQLVGDQRLPFSDRAQVRGLLAEAGP
ncbi:MAG: UDP-N-acetylmuramoyl-L-alanyl-D-glutamate--2,6-diaminopimelate ligase [Gammaproteobacteria bacterium]|nr:UDP-N-acetylmuramoyl-L-alanyl-D-glutamate--2,6-diaminopimelate ligase [Gammaproteobacteria bacterium]NIR98314.1 UDP-N-acetylmuramoyl-L-alanyl-D-glutamate--2,6-diaminopimelate ligase [Gammaproteobacteria bacterium]NIT64061.1 UDP-N-acetylmuramoyl-L-alanyl-D-glutamate--2,6-diaminopimelate ligase [Gammaproteobacteria bacterium]NIV20992.1 UDP-N-acetylmuramoyl-L-alanyl-D-glutamate--2,6-diaminopimelate ligase [Gammaproteobacteria bacterium]NIX10389.1 UDP-N-acetylmuramoyl-L-alanyl-D-glutamate--2,6-d